MLPLRMLAEKAILRLFFALIADKNLVLVSEPHFGMFAALALA
jgi:hypothetical protein